MRVSVFALLGAIALAMVACGGEDVSDDDGSSGVGAAGPPSTHVGTSQGSTSTSQVASRPEGSVATEQVPMTWTTPAGESWALDLIVPTDTVEGGWPVLVTFHGATFGTSASEMAAVASSGVVVAGPRWVGPEWTTSNLMAIDPVDYVDGDLFDLATCAFAAAQAAAAEYGGDPGRTTVEGFSAGVHPAAWVALGVARADPCPDAVSIAPNGVVLGDGQWLFEGFGGEWDATFRDPSSRATDTVDRFVNPDRWTLPDGFVAYLWSSESTDVDRSVENPPTADSWLRTRGDDELVDDLETLGAFEDGSIGFLDNGLLLEVRMQRAGVAVVHEQLPGDHSRNPTMIERTIDLAWHEPTGG